MEKCTVNKIIARHSGYDMDLLEDALLCFAANVEDSYISAGAKAGIDYSYNDIFRVAAELLKSSKWGTNFYTETI